MRWCVSFPDFESIGTQFECRRYDRLCKTLLRRIFAAKNLSKDCQINSNYPVLFDLGFEFQLTDVEEALRRPFAAARILNTRLFSHFELSRSVWVWINNEVSTVVLRHFFAASVLSRLSSHFELSRSVWVWIEDEVSVNKLRRSAATTFRRRKNLEHKTVQSLRAFSFCASLNEGFSWQT